MQTIFRTLRFKVAGAFLLWTAVFQVGLVFVIPLVRERFIMDELDSRLRTEAVEAAGALAAGSVAPDRIRDLAAAHPAAHAWGMLYQVTAPGTPAPISSSRSLERTALEPPALPGGPGPGAVGTPTVFTAAPPSPPPPPGSPAASAAEPVRYRAASVPVTTSDGTALVLTVAAPLQAMDWLGGLIRWLLLAALIPGLLGAAVAGWIVAGLTASRIDEIGRAVRAVSPTRLDQRVQVADQGDEISRMAGDINGMLDRLANTISGLERFMSEVSHELKTPVSALLAEAQVMKYSKPTPESGAKFILSVEDEMRRLGKLVESFLMLARFEHGRRYLAEAAVPINEVVDESVGHLSRFAAQSGIPLNETLYDPGDDGREAIVRGDAELLRIAFDNIIRNAIQFSDRGSPVSVDVVCDTRDVKVSIRDRGPGAPPEHIEKIFERYAQAPNQKTGRRGTGLGLSIAKGVVELHGGAIRATNHPEGGCVFTVTLPLMGPTPPIAGRFAPVSERAPSMREPVPQQRA